MTIRDVSLTVTDGKGKKHKVEFTLKQSIGGESGEDLDYQGHLIIDGLVSIPRQRIKICIYHLRKMQNNLFNEFLVKSSIEAIASNLRTATFTMQAACNKNEEFNRWYVLEVEKMKKIPQLNEMIRLRNKVEKVGYDLISFGPVIGVYHHLDGSMTDKFLTPDIKYGKFDFKDVIRELESAIQYISNVVEDAHAKGYLTTSARPTQFRAVSFKEDKMGNFQEIITPK